MRFLLGSLLLLLAGFAFAATRCATEVPASDRDGRDERSAAVVAAAPAPPAAESSLPERETMPRENGAARSESAALADSISGVVVDDHGRPVHWAKVITNLGPDARSDENGAFTFARRAEDASAIAIRSVSPAKADSPMLESLCPSQWVTWGTHDLRFVLRRRVELVVELVDTQGNAAAGEVTVVQPWESVSFDDWGGARLTVRGEGRVVFPAVARGRCTVDVESHRFARSLPREIEVGAAPNHMVVVLRERAARRVVVTDDRDVPPRWATVQLFAALPAVHMDRAALEHELRTARSPRGWHPVAGVTQSDAEGVSFEGEAGVDYVVRVLGDHEPWIVRDVRLDDPSPLVVRIPRAEGVTVTARFPTPLDADQLRTEKIVFALTPAAGAPWHERSNGVRFRWGKVAGDVVFANVPAGEWMLVQGHSEQGFPGPGPRPLASVVVGSSDVTVDVAAAPQRPGRIVLQIATEHDRSEQCVHLQRVPRDGELRPDFVEIAFPVEFDTETVVPVGSYRARLRRIPQALSDEVVEIAEGDRVDAKFHVRLGSIAVRLVNERGEPVRDARVALRRDGIVTRYDALRATDGDGIARSSCGVGMVDVVLLPDEAWLPFTGGEALVLGGGNLVQSDEPRTLLGRAFVSEGETIEVTFVVRGAPR